ncbi:hypothetical protein ASD34_04980 [Variovorax sp. Root473]|nr:hypothetical protein ASD34_04980 [Variovorax sp. Root473]
MEDPLVGMDGRNDMPTAGGAPWLMHAAMAVMQEKLEGAFRSLEARPDAGRYAHDKTVIQPLSLAWMRFIQSFSPTTL